MASGELGADPSPGAHPVSLGGAKRDPEGLGGLFFTQPGEETALNGSRETLVTGAQLGKRVVQIEKSLGLSITTDPLLVEGHRHHASAALRGETGTRAAYDHLSHGACCDGEEVASIMGADVLMGHDKDCRRWLAQYREPAVEGDDRRARRDGGRRRRV